MYRILKEQVRLSNELNEALRKELTKIKESSVGVWISITDGKPWQSGMYLVKFLDDTVILTHYDFASGHRPDISNEYSDDIIQWSEIENLKIQEEPSSKTKEIKVNHAEDLTPEGLTPEQEAAFIDWLQEGEYIVSEEEAESIFRDELDELYPVSIGSCSYAGSQVLEAIDEIAYRCAFNDWLDAKFQDVIEEPCGCVWYLEEGRDEDDLLREWLELTDGEVSK